MSGLIIPPPRTENLPGVCRVMCALKSAEFIFPPRLQRNWTPIFISHGLGSPCSPPGSTPSYGFTSLLVISDSYFWLWLTPYFLLIFFISVHPSESQWLFLLEYLSLHISPDTPPINCVVCFKWRVVMGEPISIILDFSVLE